MGGISDILPARRFRPLSLFFIIFVKMATGDTYVVADKHTKKIVEKAMDLIFERLKKAATTTPGIHKNMVIIDISKIIAEAKEV